MPSSEHARPSHHLRLPQTLLEPSASVPAWIWWDDVPAVRHRHLERRRPCQCNHDHVRGLPRWEDHERSRQHIEWKLLG